MSTSSKPRMVVYGATGAQGHRMVDGLIRIDAFDLTVTSRNASNPLLSKWAEHGVKASIVDVPTASHEDLVKILQGVDVLVSFIGAAAFDSQKPLFKAAKDAGVGRVVPSDFGPACPPGIMRIQDIKLGIREYVKSLGLPYTFIEVGWWMEFILPRPVTATDMWTGPSWRSYGDGNTPVALTDLDRIPDFVARIVQDERTLNQVVFASENETTQNEAWEYAAKSPEAAEILKKKNPTSHEQVLSELAAAQAAYDKEVTPMSIMVLAVSQYTHSIFVRGDNTRAKAKALGALDTRDLYPDMPLQNMADFAEKWYKNPTPFPY